MNWRSVNFDWNRARAFLVTVEEGSLSAAARALCLTQPTIGRQISRLEEELEIALFERVGHSLVLTPAGASLMDHVRGMGEAASRLSLTASGRSDAIEGSVRVTASEAVSVFVLPPIIARLRKDYPGISIEIVGTNELRNLRKREADIAIRNAEPTDPELIARRLPSGLANLYASEDYLLREGPFDSPDDLRRAQFIGFDENEPLLDGLNRMGLVLTSRNFPLVSNMQLVQWELVKAGAGIGVMIASVGDVAPGIARAAPWFAPIGYEVWLVAHREIRSSPRIRLVMDRLAEELGALADGSDRP